MLFRFIKLFILLCSERTSRFLKKCLLKQCYTQSLKFSIFFLNWVYFLLFWQPETFGYHIYHDERKPAKVDPTCNVFEHLQLHTRTRLTPSQLPQSIYCCYHVIDQTCQKYGQRVQSEADLSARNYFVDAVIQQTHHVHSCDKCGPCADDGWAVEDEIEKIQILLIGASAGLVDGFGDCCDDEDA